MRNMFSNKCSADLSVITSASTRVIVNNFSDFIKISTVVVTNTIMVQLYFRGSGLRLRIFILVIMLGAVESLHIK